jgi:hypothetical protein
VTLVHTIRNPLIGQTTAVAAVVGINAGGAVATNSAQRPAAGVSVAGYATGKFRSPFGPMLGPFAQELLSLYLSAPTLPSQSGDRGTRGGQ